MKAVNVDDVLRILHKYGAFVFMSDSEKYSEMVDKISNIPELKPRMGKWIRKVLEVENDDVRVTYECSECGVNQLFEEHYCPNCGAKMEVQNADSN